MCPVTLDDESPAVGSNGARGYLGDSTPSQPPYLWRTLKVTHERHALLVSDAARLTLARNTKHVRQIVIYATPDNLFLPKPNIENGEFSPAICTNLQSISLQSVIVHTEHHRFYQEPVAPELANAIVALVQQDQSSLISLHIQVNVGSSALLRLITPGSLLVQLYVHYVISAWAAKHLLETLPECIRVVRLHMVSNVSTNEANPSGSDEYLVCQPLKKSYHALKGLVIGWTSDAASEEYVLLPFLETCGPNLLPFRAEAPRYFEYKRLGAVLKRLGMDMQTLDMRSLPARMWSSDGALAATIQLGSQWQTMALKHSRLSGPLTVAAALDRCEYVRVFCARFPSKDMCTLLSRAKALERLEAISVSNGSKCKNPIILATDLLEVEWASHSLVEWTCMIRVPRPPRDQEVENGQDNNNLEESHIIQRQVYRKLAIQTGLRQLQLCRIDNRENATFDVHYSWHQDQCLEMTLASGLGELSELKELEKLDVSFMDHGIGVA